jgi:hypothetical protein
MATNTCGSIGSMTDSEGMSFYDMLNTVAAENTLP